MAWGLSGGQKWFTVPPLRRRAVLVTPLPLGILAAHSPLGFPRTVQGLGVCILPIKKHQTFPEVPWLEGLGPQQHSCLQETGLGPHPSP